MLNWLKGTLSFEESNCEKEFGMMINEENRTAKITSETHS